MHLWILSASLMVVGDGAAAVLPSDSTPGTVVNCTSRSAAIHNLTVYGTEILYTPVAAAPGDNSTGADIDTSTSFEFQLYNAVLGVDAQCSTHVNQTDDASASTTWHPCFVESRDTRIAAAFRFYLGEHTLTVNETWVCDDNSGGSASFQATATNSIDVLCTETVNTAVGQHYCARVASGPLLVNVTRVGGE